MRLTGFTSIVWQSNQWGWLDSPQSCANPTNEGDWIHLNHVPIQSMGMTGFTSIVRQSNQWGWLDSPQPSGNVTNINNSHWSAMLNLNAQTIHHTFFLNLPFSHPFQPPILPLTFNLKHPCPCQDNHSITSIHNHYIGNWSIVSFKPIIKSSALLWSLSCTSHIDLIIDISGLYKILMPLSFRNQASLPCKMPGLT